LFSESECEDAPISEFDDDDERAPRCSPRYQCPSPLPTLPPTPLAGKRARLDDDADALPASKKKKLWLVDEAETENRPPTPVPRADKELLPAAISTLAVATPVPSGIAFLSQHIDANLVPLSSSLPASPRPVFSA
jgi:hypothetical protein